MTVVDRVAQLKRIDDIRAAPFKLGAKFGGTQAVLIETIVVGDSI